MKENEIPATMPMVTVGDRICVVHARSWVQKDGSTRTVLALSEVVPARMKGTTVLAWKRAFPQRVALQMDTLDEWDAFVQTLSFALKVHGAPGTTVAVRASPSRSDR